jgi:uncharacterized membrane protein
LASAVVIPALIVLAAVMLIVLVAPMIALARAFSRLSSQQRQIDALAARVEALASALAERPREQPQPPAAPEPVRAKPPAQPLAAPAPVISEPVVRRQVHSVEPEHVAEESLETQIGARWLLYVGVVAIIVGVAYFEKLAFENHWVGETARVIQGGVAGLALIYTGIRFARAGYSTYGQMISGCGAAILYVSTYAAFNFYHLIDQPVAFGVMVAVTAGTALLADRERSQGLAVLAVGAGFATPFMLPGTADSQLALFGYDTVLIAGTVALSTRRDWPLLDVISYVFTLLTVAEWGGRFYAPQKFLRTEVFLTVFCAMFLAIIYAHRRSSSPGVAFAKLVLWSAAPAYYLASLAVLGNHATAMLVWLVALALTSAILAASVGALAGFGVWLATALPLLLWCVTHLAVGWTTPGLIVVSTIYAIALAAQLYRVSEHAEAGPADVVWLHLNALLMFAGAYILIDAVRPSTTGTVAAAFAVWHGALAFGLLSRDRDRALHFAGVAFTLLTIAIGLQFQGAAVTIGWAAEGATAVWLGVRERRDWLHAAGAGLFLVAIGRTADLLVSQAPLSQTPVLNARAACAVFVIALCYALAWLHHVREDAPAKRAHVAVAIVAAQLVTAMLITSEIDAYWAARADALTRELAKSVAWALYATLLIVIGLRRDYAPVRYFAILLFALTTAKVFFADMANLERVYRILSIIGLGIALLVTSYLYQRARPEK